MKLNIKGKTIEYDPSLTYLDISKTGKIVQLDFEQLQNEKYLEQTLDTKLQIIFSSLFLGETFSIDSYINQEKEKITENQRKGIENTIELYRKIFKETKYRRKESLLHEALYMKKDLSQLN